MRTVECNGGGQPAGWRARDGQLLFPTVHGIAVVEDVFIAIYLAIVSVVLSGETEIWPIVVQLATAFAFLIAMFVIARFGG